MSDSRLRWILTTATFADRRAHLRAFWHYIVRRHHYELCGRCGRPVGPHTGSWWSADDDLWAVVVGDPNGVLCPPCFTRMADSRALSIRWVAVRDAEEARP